VNNLPKVATQWNSGVTRDSNRGRQVLIPSALTTTPPSHHPPPSHRDDVTYSVAWRAVWSEFRYLSISDESVTLKIELFHIVF